MYPIYLYKKTEQIQKDKINSGDIRVINLFFMGVILPMIDIGSWSCRYHSSFFIERPRTMKLNRRAFIKRASQVGAGVAAGVVIDHFLLNSNITAWVLSVLEVPTVRSTKAYYAGDRLLIGWVTKELPFDSLPPALWQALVAIEDKRYFSRASSLDREGLVAWLSKGRGGSTLPMQLAEMMLPRSTNRLIQKKREYALGQKLLNRQSKEEILARYINSYQLIADGDTPIVGLEDTALRLFNKPYNQLLFEECVMLACMYKSPTKINRRNPAVKERAVQRWIACGKTMKELGYISPDLFSKKQLGQVAAKSYEDIFTATNFTNIFGGRGWLRSLREMRSSGIDPRVMKQVHKEETADIQQADRIDITIDPELQLAAQGILTDVITEIILTTNTLVDWFIYMINDKWEVVVDVPSYDFVTNQQYITNKNKFQVWSTVKPVILALAAQEGYVNLAKDRFDDLPGHSFNGYEVTNRTSAKHPEGYYTGSNSSYRSGIQTSSNVMMIDMLNRIRAWWWNGVKLLRAFITQITGEDRNNDASIFLWSGGLTPSQLAKVYQLLIHGKRVEPHYIKSYTKQGTKHPIPIDPSEQFFSPTICAQVHTITQATNPVNGNWYGWRCKKTWTVDDERNGWTVFYHPEKGLTMVCGIYAPPGEKIWGYSSDIVAPIGYRLLQKMQVPNVPSGRLKITLPSLDTVEPSWENEDSEVEVDEYRTRADG